MSEGKLVIFSAPSGAGKTTIVSHLLTLGLNFGFSISATTRKPRGIEQNGKEYYFLSVEEFKSKISRNEFLEWEEVYPGCFYGTLKSEVERISQNGQNILFDIDVVGGSNIKKFYRERALAVFIQAPSIEELKKRLENRSTDSPEIIKERIEKAELEMSYVDLFDVVIVNDQLEDALWEAADKVRKFLYE
ncbi:MAG: guanylate kinase [Mariniphaga sp.]